MTPQESLAATQWSSLAEPVEGSMSPTVAQDTHRFSATGDLTLHDIESTMSGIAEWCESHPEFAEILAMGRVYGILEERRNAADRDSFANQSALDNLSDPAAWIVEDLDTGEGVLLYEDPMAA